MSIEALRLRPYSALFCFALLVGSITLLVPPGNATVVDDELEWNGGTLHGTNALMSLSLAISSAGRCY